MLNVFLRVEGPSVTTDWTTEQKKVDFTSEVRIWRYESFDSYLKTRVSTRVSTCQGDKFVKKFEPYRNFDEIEEVTCLRGTSKSGAIYYSGARRCALYYFPFPFPIST